MSKSVTQNDLRRLMSKESASVSAKKSSSNKYKLSVRELALIEEQKRLKEEKKKAKLAIKQSKKEPAGIPQGFFDAAAESEKKPKGILKNSGGNKRKFDEIQPEKTEKHPELETKTINKSEETTEEGGKSPESEEESNELPEGFFDDPKLDAKARKIEYKDPAEEEWEKFKKEIGQEIEFSKDLAGEDQAEAVEDRQLDEVDEQIAAWKKVNNLEKRFESVKQSVVSNKADNTVNSIKEEEESDEDPDDLFDWRKKKS